MKSKKQMSVGSKRSFVSEEAVPKRRFEFSPPRGLFRDDDAPTFSLKKFGGSNWRDAITVPDDDLEDYGVFATNESSHHMRIYDLAVKKHQELGCGKGGKMSDCVYCHAQGGGPNLWKGDAKKKFITMRLYLQVIKFYIPELGDYCAEFPEVYEDSTEDTTDIRKLPTNIYFFDYMFPMMYCAKCYPDIPEAIAAMDAYQTYTPEFQKEKGSDHSNYYAERHKILTDLKSQKELKKNEFSLFLKQISIMSEFDWTLHLFSDKHNMKDCVKPVAEEVKDVKTVLEVVKNEILGLSSVMTGQVAVSNMVSAFLKDEKIAKFGKNTANVVSFVSEKSEQTGRTQLEDIISEIVKTRLKVFKKQCQNQETESLTTSAASAIGDMIDERLFEIGRAHV